MFESFGFLVAAALVAVIGIKSIRIVPQQTALIVERLGRYYATLEPGMSFLIPFVDRPAYSISLKEVPYDTPEQVCITRDNVQVIVDGVLYYRVTNANRAAYGTQNFEIAIMQLAQTTLRSEIGKREMDKMLEERNEINSAVVGVLDEASNSWGVKVLRYEIKNITPPQRILVAMEQQVTAEREKRAMIANSEGQRQRDINLAEGEKQAAIARSEGDRQAAINAAEGDAQAVKLMAEATAAAITQVGESLAGKGGQEAASLKIAEQYVQAFSNLAKEGNTLILPADTGNVGGMIAQAMAVVGATKK